MKKALYIISAFFLIASVLVTVSSLQQKQQTKSRASASTTLFFAPSSSIGSPLQKNVGDTVSLDLMIDPGTNIVTFVRFQLTFDSTKLALVGNDPFTVNTPTIYKQEGPVIKSGTIAESLSVGSDPTKTIQKITKLGTISFKAIGGTQTNPTLITFSTLTQALSADKNAQAEENVLSTTTPAAIAIAGNSQITSTPAPTGGVTPMPTFTPFPTGQTTTLSFTVLLDGIGNRGDNPNPNGSSLSNKNPLHPQRNLAVWIFNTSNQQVASRTAAMLYDPNSGAFVGQVDLGSSFPAGSYNIKIKTDGYLRKLVPGIITIQPLQDNPVPPTALVAGDTNADNILNVLDYNALLDCGFGEINPLPMADPNAIFNRQNCQNHPVAQLVDLEDNGIINSADYNLFIRELSVQNGD